MAARSHLRKAALNAFNQDYNVPWQSSRETVARGQGPTRKASADRVNNIFMNDAWISTKVLPFAGHCCANLAANKIA